MVFHGQRNRDLERQHQVGQHPEQEGDAAGREGELQSYFQHQ
ncbi:hypothetical protein PL9214520361 [Planktothrix tepida PCC 9214]|uniref:Uncharacterized protein n=1 Tax=Planktothrix tepida PCC 9214 TaxID=671072 RepID=A0A1J1LNK8_9CYAN|nr:hypothetical protein PL9214520361 [Planktothrix tepida PCC 9214]